MIASLEPIARSIALRIDSTLDPQTRERLAEALRRVFDSKNQLENGSQGPNGTAEEQLLSADHPLHSLQSPQEPDTPPIPETDDSEG